MKMHNFDLIHVAHSKQAHIMHGCISISLDGQQSRMFIVLDTPSISSPRCVMLAIIQFLNRWKALQRSLKGGLGDEKSMDKM